MNMIDQAAQIAMEFHHGQENKHNGEPYILHPHRVFMAVRDAGYPADYQAVAWLHDTVEDTELTIADLTKFFPEEVWAAVSCLTKIKGESNVDYYNRVGTNHIARQVKFHDIYDNFRRNHTVQDEATRLRMAAKYSLGIDILSGQKI